MGGTGVTEFAVKGGSEPCPQWAGRCWPGGKGWGERLAQVPEGKATWCVCGGGELYMLPQPQGGNCTVAAHRRMRSLSRVCVCVALGGGTWYLWHSSWMSQDGAKMV